jgi:hypothetical protein
MLVGINFFIGIGGGHIDIESFYQFTEFLTAPAAN